MCKKIYLMSIGVLVCSFLIVSFIKPATVFSKVWTVKFSAGYPPGAHFAKTATWYFNQVEANSGGRIKMEYYYGGSICKLGQEMKAFHAHTIDAAVFPPSYVPAALPLSQIFDLEYLTSAADANQKAIVECYHKFKPLEKEVEANNAIYLWPAPVTNNTLWTTFPASNLDTLKGKRIRATGWSGDILSLFGASPVGLLWGDIYNSARTGIISGAYHTPLSLGWTSKFYEVMPYVTHTGAGVFGHITIMMRKDLFEQFPADLQKVFLDWIPKALEESLNIVAKDNMAAVDDMVKRGVKFTIWSQEERAKAAAMAKPAQFAKALDKLKAQGLGKEAEQLKDIYLEELEKFEKTSKYKNEFDYWREKYGKD